MNQFLNSKFLKKFCFYMFEFTRYCLTYAHCIYMLRFNGVYNSLYRNVLWGQENGEARSSGKDFDN